MNYQKKPPLTSREIQLLILIGVVTVIVLATLIGADIRLSHGLSGGGGFFSAWEGARAFLFRHADPYGVAVATATQQLVYGRAAGAGENQYLLGVPFFLLPLYFPFSFFPDPQTARGIWVFLNQAALVGVAFLAVQLIDWKPSRIFHVAYALLAVFGIYSVLAIIEGGPAILLGVLYVAILFAYCNEQDELAGALLVLALFAWEIGLPFVVLLLWKALYDKRGRFLAGFGMIFVVLLVVSLLIYPGWIFPYLISTLATLRASFGTTAPAVLTRLYPAYGQPASQALSVLTVLLLLYEWSATRGGDIRRFIWAACLTLAVTPLIGMRSDVSNMVVLVPSLALIFSATASRWRGGYLLAGLLFLIALLLPWGFFLRWYWFQEQRANDYLFIFAPLFSAAGLYWTRWWFVRPPRTWFEHVRSTLNPARRSGESKRSPGPSAEA